MRRADRLFQIIQVLRRRKVTTAARLADELEVSERTIYRDVSDLVASGVPIEGEAGIGYRLPKGFDLPPLMFSIDEIEALVLGARMVKSFADPGLARAAEDVLQKVQAVLPERLQKRVGASVLFAPNFKPSAEISERLSRLRQAISDRRKVRLDYQDAGGQQTARVVRPVCLAFIAPLWMVACWCELREEFRNFRLDRIRSMQLLDDRFVDEPNKTVEDFLRRVGSE